MLRKITLAVLVAFLSCPVMIGANDNSNSVVDGLLGYIAPVTPPQVLRCIGGEPIGEEQCSPETHRIISRDEVQTWGPVALAGEGADLLDGLITFTVNCNFNAEYRGPCWGTFAWDAAGGTWEGQWVTPVMDLVTYESKISMVGIGEGGDIEGKHLKLDGYSNPGDWYITFTARVK